MFIVSMEGLLSEKDIVPWQGLSIHCQVDASRTSSVHRPHSRPQRLILQAQPLLLLRLLRLFRLRRRRFTLCLAAQFAGVEFGDQVTQGAERVVVVVFGNLGAAAGGVGAVAVEFGFVEEVGAGAIEDAERAVLQAGADGG